jgi:hypothetical protein
VAAALARSRIVDHSGDPEDLVGCREAARVLGYRFPSGLPLVVFDRADVPHRPRRWKRQTLWMLGDELDRNMRSATTDDGAPDTEAMGMSSKGNLTAIRCSCSGISITR